MLFGMEDLFCIHHVPPARAADKKIHPTEETKIKKRDHATTEFNGPRTNLNSETQ